MFRSTAIDGYMNIIKANDDNEEQYTDYWCCSHCPKSMTCCQTCPCELHPSDLPKVDEETIISLLDTGMVVIDWYEGDLEEYGYDEYPVVYFLRIRGNQDISSIEAGWFQSCYALGSNGCVFPFDHRPFGGRRLMPCSKKEDDEKNSKAAACLEWRPYYDLLKKIVWEYDDVPFIERPD